MFRKLKFWPFSADQQSTFLASSIAGMFSVDVFIEILLNVDDRTLWNCRLVCKTFRQILESPSFWMHRCARYNVEYPVISTITLKQKFPDLSGNDVITENIDYRRIYFKKPYGRNLIKNPSGENKLQYWTKIMSGGDGFRIEHPPDGSDTEGFPYCFATSFAWSCKQQIVDLVEEGCDEWVLDNLKPKICVSEWTAARFDCASVYIFRALLQRSALSRAQESFRFLGPPFREQGYRYFDDDDDAADHASDGLYESRDPQVLAAYRESTVVQQWAGRAWKETSHIFENYPAGVRFVVFQSFGKDLQFWKDWYGPKMAKASVSVQFD